MKSNELYELLEDDYCMTPELINNRIYVTADPVSVLERAVIDCENGTYSVRIPLDLDFDVEYSGLTADDVVELLTDVCAADKLHHSIVSIPLLDVCFNSADDRLFWYLSKHTHMLKNEIKRQIIDGVSVYQNNPFGLDEFKTDWIASLCDEEEAAEAWKRLDVVGNYRFDWAL